jgi:hypothetical protein
VLRPLHTDLQSDAELLSPGVPVPVRVEIQPFDHVFRAGSAIRLSIDAPGPSLVALPAVATNAVEHTPGMKSSIVLGDLPGAKAYTPLPPCSARLNQPCRATSGTVPPGSLDIQSHQRALSSPAPATTTAVAPILSRLTVAPSAFRAAASGPTVLAASIRRPGALVSYRDTEPATTTLTLLAPQRGIKVGGSCARPPKHAKRKHRPKTCTRLVATYSVSRADRAGENRLRFTGRVKGRGLAAGLYELRLIARNSAGQTSRPISTRFRIRR